MKSKGLLVSLLGILVIAFAIATVSASEEFAQLIDVEVNGVSIALDQVDQSIGVSVSETIPVVVKFTALRDVTDVRVKVYVEGYKSEVSEETSRFQVLEGNTYVKRFTLKLPSSMDVDDLSEEVSLLVRISAKGEESKEFYVPLEIQRELYSLNLLSVDVSDVVVIGDQVSADVVIENNGYERLDNVYVRASIPNLGISRKIYVGDLASVQDEYDDDLNDAVIKKVYLTIPRNTAPGTYEMEIEAYNYDTSVTTTGRVVLKDVEAGVLPTATTKTVAPGEEVSFDLVLVNPNDRMVVYTIIPEQTKGLLVGVTEPVVAVSAQTSKTVKITVKATDSVEEGTYPVRVSANSESGLSKQVSFSVSVEKKATTNKLGTGSITGTAPSNTVVVVTVILVIVFVVLLIILIVLLTRKPAEAEEYGETNYY